MQVVTTIASGVSPLNTSVGFHAHQRLDHLRTGPHDLLEVIDDRAGSRSSILASQLPV